MMDSYTLLNMVYDLIAQNPIKGVYDSDHDELTNIVSHVTDNEIEFVDSVNRRRFTLTLTESQ